jgi:uncharacterized protein YdhG (YjbR/CyaY superfamily)
MSENTTHVVDELIANTPPPHRAEFERIRDIVKEVVPSATQGVSYAMATYFYKNKPFLSFAHTKKFLSLYPFSGKVIAKLEDKLKDFECTPGSVHFSVEHPLPEALLKEIITTKLEEITEKKPR